MAAKRPTVGLDHPTVVPANFDPERDGVTDPDGGDDADEGNSATGTKRTRRTRDEGNDGPR